jgi:PAS domain S-box-containing protein
MIESVSQEITERKRAEEALRESEERFRQMAGLSPFPISIIGEDGKYLYINKKFTDLFGYKLEDIPSGKDWFRKAHPDKNYREKVVSAWKFDLEKSGKYETRRREFSVVCNDGTVRDIVFRPVSMDKERQFITYEDLTERKRAEEALRESEARYRSVFENTGTAMMIIEEDTAISMVNTEFERLSGYSKEEVEGRMSWKDFVVKEDRARMERYHAKRREDEGNAPTEYEFHFFDKQGNIKDIFNKVGMIPGTKRSAAALMDITSRKQAEEKLQEMFKQIKKGYDDHLSILNMLRLGIATVDRDGSVSFLNQTVRQLIGKGQRAVLGRHWEELFSFSEDDKARLRKMMERPAKAREHLQAQVAFDEGRHHWMDIEVQDDPPNPERKIFFFYDMSEVYDLRRMLEDKARFHDIVGKSKPMQSIYRRIQEVSGVDWTVLIEGETGTGKELVARAIHSSSHRKDKPFVAVNCAGLTDSLLTSQLFGHKRGAFTGAVEDHKGLFEVADGGTLLLDEIGDISKSMQRSLLRVLEEKAIIRLGESKARRIDVRILASTHRDLSQEAEKGHFRPDLLYRIRVARIKLPLLGERREDMPLLIAAFLGQSRAATGKAVQGVSNQAMRVLLQHDWPGNVRELKSAIDFATLHCKAAVIKAEDLPPEIVYSKHSQAAAGGPFQDERQRLLAALDGAKGNRTVAARHLGISRATLYRRLADLDIKPVR